MEFIFITGAGRCGTSLTRGLFDGHSKLDVIPAEVSNLLGLTLRYNGHSPNILLTRQFGHILGGHLVNAYNGLESRDRVAAAYDATIEKNLGRELTFQQFLEMFCRDVVGMRKDKVVLDLTSEHIKGLLEVSPTAKVVHLLRHPMNCLNSHYRLRFRDANSFGGAFPGLWEFGTTFERILTSFSQASQLKTHPRVKIVRLEDLQADPRSVFTDVLDFVGLDYEEINAIHTRNGVEKEGNSTVKSSSKVVQQDDDWSCLSGNDLFYISRVPCTNEFYAIEPTEYVKNGYWRFLKRQLGYIGKKRIKARWPDRAPKVAVVSIAQYIMDLRDKTHLQYVLGIDEFNDGPCW